MKWRLHDVINIFLFLKKNKILIQQTAALLFSFVSEIPACKKFDVMMEIDLV